MSKTQNIIFCALGIIVLCAAFFYKAADIGEFIPESLYNGQRSYLEGAPLQKLPEFSFASFEEGTLQDETEAYLSGCWPARDAALLTNAALQRTIISAANVPFGFEAYPTFFDSTRLYLPQVNALVESPLKATDKARTALESTAEALNNFSKEHPETQIVFCLTDRSMISPSNPAFTLGGTDVIDYEYVQEHLFSKLNPNITVITEPQYTPEKYFEKYFSTDHHWNIHGAYSMYNLLAKELDLDVVEPSGYADMPNISFYGSNARNGLDGDVSDSLFDYRFDLPDYQVWRNGKQIERNHRTEVLSQSESVNKNNLLYNTYSYYYGTDYDRIVYTVPDNGNKSDCIIIGDSYTQPIEPLISAAYQSTFVFDPRFYEKSLEACIESNDISALIVIAGVNTLADGSTVQLF